MSEILVIIPAYNEEKSIVSTVEKIRALNPAPDYCIVNDGSSDDTAVICKEHDYNLLDLPINLGLAGAFQAGMRYACMKGYKYAVQFDGDGQHRPEYIYPMYLKAREGYNIVIASRFAAEYKPFSIRMLGSNLIELAILFSTGHKIKDPTSGMRMFDRGVIETFASRINYAPEPDTLAYLLRQGLKVTEIQASMDIRTQGKSYLTPINAARYMVRMLTSIIIIQNFREKRKDYI